MVIGLRPGARRISRRAFAAGAAGALLAGRVHLVANADGPVLRLLCWQGYDNGDALKAFTAKTGVTVKADYVGANDEFFLKLRAGGVGKYDLVTPANGVVGALLADGLIQPLNESRLASIAECLEPFQRPAWSTVNGQFVGAPFVWGAPPMIVSSKFTTAPTSWTDLLDKKYDGKIILTNDSVSNIMIWNRALGAADPAKVSLTQLNATMDVLLRIKREYAGAYTGDMGQVADRLAKGKQWIATVGWEAIPAFNGYAGAGLELARPDPGVFSFCDNLCLVSQAPNPEAAYAFIDYMRSADAQVSVVNAIKRGTVNAAAVSRLDEYARGAFDYDHLDQFIERSPFYGFPPLSNGDDDTATYVDWVNAWETINGARLNSGPTPTPTAAPKIAPHFPGWP
jgi:spermidine/putrescine transport system substrate-binding protein